SFGDGGVMFDEGVDNGAGKPAGRFIVWAIDFVSLGDFYIAVSNDADPTHGFTERHKVDMSEGQNFVFDYPRFGMNADSYVFTVNQYGPFGYDHVRLLTIDKPSVLDGNATTFTSFQATPPGSSGAHFTM